MKITAKFDECWKKVILQKFQQNAKKFDEFWLEFWDLSGAKDCKSCRSRKMQQNDYLLAKIGVYRRERALTRRLVLALATAWRKKRRKNESTGQRKVIFRSPILRFFLNRACTHIRLRAWGVPNARLFLAPFLNSLFIKRIARLSNFGLSVT